jgi:SAM-dependent methyltransferase
MQTRMDSPEKFREIWKGGYYEGDPMEPMSRSSYGICGFNSVLYTVYLTCIRPYINSDTRVLEIGPGRGAWTKTLLKRGAKKVFVIDAAPPEHTGFWDYVGKTDRVEYNTVSDLTLAPIPDGGIDFFFSFGVFCHLSPESCETYISSLARKLRPGAEAFLMIADYDKFNRCIDDVDRVSLKAFLARNPDKIWQPTRLAFNATWKFFGNRMINSRISKQEDLEGTHAKSAGRWYHWGLDRACEVIEREGFTIVERDMEIVARDPVIHFRKPLVGAA